MPSRAMPRSFSLSWPSQESSCHPGWLRQARLLQDVQQPSMCQQPRCAACMTDPSSGAARTTSPRTTHCFVVTQPDLPMVNLLQARGTPCQGVRWTQPQRLPEHMGSSLMCSPVSTLIESYGACLHWQPPCMKPVRSVAPCGHLRASMRAACTSVLSEAAVAQPACLV